MATYHVKKTGNDTTGDGSDALPWLTIGKGVTTMAASDTLVIHTGTYAESINDTAKTGVSGSPTIIKANGSLGSYDVVTLQPASGTRVVYVSGNSFITFQGLLLDATNVTSDCVKIELSSHNITLEDCEVFNAKNGAALVQGVLVQSSSNNGVLRRCHIHDNGTDGQMHGVYLNSGTNWLIEQCVVHDNSGYGLQIYANPTFCTVQDCIIYDNGTVGASNVILSNDDHIFQRNIVYNNLQTNDYGVRVQNTTPARTIVRHNTLYNAGTTGIYIASGATGIGVYNNVVIGSTTPIDNQAGAGATVSGNITSGTASSLFTNPATFDLTLKAGSAAIDAAATTDLGLGWNGADIDCGAFETIAFSSASVENGAESVIRVNFENDIKSPILPATGITGFTSTKNGANNPIVSAVRSGSNTVLLTVTNAIAMGNTVTISYSGGNLTDSALCGGTLCQPFVATLSSQAVTNNVIVPDVAPGAPTGLTVTRL